MDGLQLKTFFSGDRDWELDQYRILAGIQAYHQEVRGYRLYPALGEMIKVASALEEIIENKSGLKQSFPKQIKDFDIRDQTVTFETLGYFVPEIEYMFKLIKWAIPLLRKEIDEGTVLYDFVENNIQFEQIGIAPLYKDEGHLLISDNQEKIKVYSYATIQGHSYVRSIYASDARKFRILKTKLIKEFDSESLGTSPESMKLDLIDQYGDLPNLATYFCETDIDLPFDETLFPVVKNRLLTEVAR